MSAQHQLLRVTLVGRPNVGKSTLFNRFVGKHLAITTEEAGTTRDRLEHAVTLGRGLTFILTDVGGIESSTGGTLDDDIQAQVRHAVNRSDLVIFLVDAKTELTADDIAAADYLRSEQVPVIFVANKWESGTETDLMQFAELGLGVPLGVSALHMAGFDELSKQLSRQLRAIRKESKKSLAEPEIEIDANIAFVGRPNVGKSSLVNCLMGEERVVVSEIPCTTRDTNDVLLTRDDKTFRLLDTAGLRRRGQIGKGLDRYATGRTLNALQEADVALVLIDGEAGIMAQDCHVLEEALKAGVSIVLVVNKIDTWEDFEETQTKFIRELQRRFHFAPWLPVVMISAKTGRHVGHVFEQVAKLQEQRNVRVKTRELNLWLKRTMAEHMPTRVPTRAQPKIKYITQAETCPPTFVLFVNKNAALHFSYTRYLENQLREAYGFAGTPIRLQIRQQDPDKNPYSPAKTGKDAKRSSAKPRIALQKRTTRSRAKKPTTKKTGLDQ